MPILPEGWILDIEKDIEVQNSRIRDNIIIATVENAQIEDKWFVRMIYEHQLVVKFSINYFL